MAVAMVTTAVRQTPTIDEPVYVGAAEVYRREHSLRFNPEHPPLGKLVIAAGTAFADARLKPGFDGNQTELGRRLLYESGNDPGRLMLLARLPVIALTLLSGLVVFAFARDLAGGVGGLAALALYAFSPDVIAHGSLATLDVPAAGFLLTSVWLLWRARRRPLLCLPLAGAALGAAVATKMSMLAAVPVLLLLAALSAVVHHSSGRSRGDPGGASAPAASGGPRLSHLPRAARLFGPTVLAASVVALACVAVVWASYLAVDPQVRWTTPGSVPDTHGLRGRLVGLLPFPEPFRDGMLLQFAFEKAGWEGFLFGRHYSGSLWYYLPAALLVKTPLGALALWAAGAVALVAVPRLRPAAPYVLLPAAVLLLAAMSGDRDLGVRYAVFLPMLLAVAAAGAVSAVRSAGAASADAAADATRAPVPRRTGPWRRARAVTAALLLLSVAVSSLRTFPYYLPYANEAFGGPSNTHRHLHDSNVDWGQDLGRLAEHLRKRYRGERVWLVYKGSGVPSHYGISASDPRKVPPDRVRGVLVVSNSSIAKAEGRLAALVAGSRPVEQVGHSITVFRR
ncbi:phospholipid carrier-dependent glycosyltransferase [Streptomyces albus]|uniref:phospholipid carrier-dependent glycosyltransferase n=1 Tax=Streptomyces albus TaxID=1888 RepID=UPI000690F5FF|nr:phospholipid carrier-dependent glycosyltransferase [Streptomyces albus]